MSSLQKSKKYLFLESHQSIASVFSCRPDTKKMYLKCQFKNASEASFPDWQKETCYWQHYRNKIPAETHQSVPIPWSGKQIMQKRLCNLMQVHPWAKLVAGLGNINKVHLNQTHFSPLAPKICFGDLDGFWYRCNRFLRALILTKPILWGSSEVCQYHKWHTPFHCLHISLAFLQR